MNFITYLFTKDFLKQLLYASIILLIIALLLLWWLKITTRHNQQIEVPNLAKLSIIEVEKKLNDIDLRYEIIDSANYNPDYPKYSVIEQIPKAGKFVKQNRKIYLTLNPSGYRKIKIPNVIGKTRRQAEPTLRAVGFRIGKVSYIPYIAKDEVLGLKHRGKDIKAGEKLQKTAVIDLILGDGSGNLNPFEEEKPKSQKPSPIENTSNG